MNRRNDNRAFFDVKLPFQNFQGLEKKYNPKGSKNFNFIIDDPEVAREMEEEGWNVKWLKAREEDDVDRAHLEVGVRFDGPFPPKITLIREGGRTRIGDEEVETLAWLELSEIDIVIRPFEWEPGRLKAYLKTMVATVIEDEVERKYA